MTPYETLRLLRDVPGVVGSCLVDGDAKVLSRDLPADIGDELLTGVGRRAHAVLSASGRTLPGAAGVALRYARLSVFCGRAGRNVLLVLCTPETSTMSVKAAIGVSAPDLARGVDRTPPPSTVAPEPPRRRGSGIWG